MKEWEVVADNLKKAGGVGWVSAIDSNGLYAGGLCKCASLIASVMRHSITKSC